MAIALQDMDKVEAAKGGSMLSPGYHLVQIASAVEGTSSGGYDQVEFEFTSPRGNIRDWLVFAPAKKAGEVPFALKRARAILDAVGIEAQGGDWAFPTTQLIGKKLTIFVGEEPDSRDPSKMRRRVQGYEPPREVDNSAGLPVNTGALADDDEIPF